MSDSRIHEADETEVQEPRKRGLFRRGEDGLTTLEWLLIVAAVAGLAALAVVLVSNVVDQTAEQIGGSSARKTAAEIAAVSIREVEHAVPTDEDEWTALEGEFRQKCTRLNITYGDVEPKLEAEWTAFSQPLSAQWATAVAVAASWQAALAADGEGCFIN